MSIMCNTMNYVILLNIDEQINRLRLPFHAQEECAILQDLPAPAHLSTGPEMPTIFTCVLSWSNNLPTNCGNSTCLRISF